MATALKTIFLSFIAVIGLSLSACRALEPAVEVLSGNHTYGRGQYQKAILHYLNAEDLVASSTRDVVHYNLGNVYYALGEGKAALQAWALAERSTDDIDTLFRIAFNRGVVYLNWGRYEEAYRSFRRALVLKPMDIDSKINLEDALSRIRSETAQPGKTGDAPKTAGDTGTNNENSLLLEYIKRKEAEGWPPQETDGADVQDW